MSHCPFQRDDDGQLLQQYVRLQGEPDLGSVSVQPRHDAKDPKQTSNVTLVCILGPPCERD